MPFSSLPFSASRLLVNQGSAEPTAKPGTPTSVSSALNSASPRLRGESSFPAPRRLGGGILLTLLLLCVSCSKKEEKEVEAPVPVQVTAVTQDNIRHIVAGDGALFPLDQQNVMPKISAPVKKFYVNRGDRVKAGQLLAVLENRDLTAQVAESKGAVDQAESNLRMTQGANVPESAVKAQTDVQAAQQAADAARQVLESREQLLKEGALAKRLVDEARVNYAQANAALLNAKEHLRALQSVSREEQVKTAAAQVESAKAHYQSTEAQVAYSEVHSPINGVVSDRPLYAGDMASTGNPLFVIMDNSRVVARVNVPQAQATVVKIGQDATIQLTGTGLQVPGKVTVVSPATDPSTTTVQVWVEAQNPDGRLKPGAAVHAAITAELFKAAPIVPSAAIFPGEEGGTSVLVIRDGVAHRRVVQVGVRDGDRVQIVSGVNAGEEVVIQGGMGVDDGAKVKVVDTTGKEELEEEPEVPEPAAPAKKDEKKK